MALQLEEVVEDPADVVQRVRALDVARELHDVPRVAPRNRRSVGDRLGPLGLGQARPLLLVLARRFGVLVEVQQAAQRSRQVLARLDQVEHPVLHEEPGRLEALGELLANRLLDHRRPGEPDVRGRL
jgi:hypothetical protein